MRAEKALRASNEKLLKTAREQERMLRELTLFRTLLDQSNDAIQVIDPETMRFLDVNERACVELGYSREELLSMTVFDIDPNVDESLRARVRAAVAGVGLRNHRENAPAERWNDVSGGSEFAQGATGPGVRRGCAARHHGPEAGGGEAARVRKISGKSGRDDRGGEPGIQVRDRKPGVPELSGNNEGTGCRTFGGRVGGTGAV